MRTPAGFRPAGLVFLLLSDQMRLQEATHVSWGGPRKVSGGRGCTRKSYHPPRSTCHLPLTIKSALGLRCLGLSSPRPKSEKAPQWQGNPSPRSPEGHAPTPGRGRVSPTAPSGQGPRGHPPHPDPHSFTGLRLNHGCGFPASPAVGSLPEAECRGVPGVTGRPEPPAGEGRPQPSAAS